MPCGEQVCDAVGDALAALPAVSADCVSDVSLGQVVGDRRLPAAAGPAVIHGFCSVGPVASEPWQVSSHESDVKFPQMLQNEFLHPAFVLKLQGECKTFGQ